MKNLLLIFFFAIATCGSARAQIVNIPDIYFKYALLYSNCTRYPNGGVGDADTNDNGEIEVSEAQAIDLLGVSNSNISDLTGVQYFTNLKYLYCANNLLTTLNVQGINNLQLLECQNNQLTSLNVQGLASLETLWCDHNNLTNINLHNLPGLANLQCYNNLLTSLDLQNPTNLRTLYAWNNQFTTLDLQSQTNMYHLRCGGNQLTTLNLQGTVLQFLYCYNSPISCLPFLPQTLVTLDVGLTNITCLPNIPPNLTTTIPLCQPNNANGCDFAARIYGNIYNDSNQNCTIEASDIAQQNILVQAKNTATQEVYTTNSKAGGAYELGLPTPATYEVKCFIQNNNYWQACGSQMVYLQANTDQIQRNLTIKPIVQCADVEVNHQLQNTARPCSTAIYKASSFNAGTITATGLTATITLPNELTLLTASYPFTSPSNGVYTLALPNMAALSRDTFSFSAAVGCSAAISQALCTNVEITPNTYCTSGGQVSWDGSDVRVSGRCIGNDSVRFIIQNVGQGGMSTGRNYTVIEDDIMIRGNAFQLAAGASDSTTVRANPTRVYRIIADEAPSNPAGNTQETFMVWGCNGLNGMHWGFVNQFGLNNGRSNPHNLCEEVGDLLNKTSAVAVANDIAGTPKGVFAQHFIVKNADLEYKIRFQNTGTATASVVRILDKLPAELDASTLRIGTASHPFTWRLASNGVLEFLFQNILLPDGTTNEAGSHGFITYRIAPKPNLSVGTTINNQAQIYFDVNAPIATNIYTHTIGENLSTILFTTPQIVDNQYFIKIFPNPMRTEATLEISTKAGVYTQENLNFTLYNTLGQAVQQQTFAGQTLTLTRNDLPQGIYFYSITQNGKLIARGKLEAQ
jgi:Secretion system C-terminal sorting domain